MAGSGVYGDFKRLRELANGIALIDSPDWLRRLNKQLAEEARAQVVESFERGVDPYDRPWLPSHRGGQTLRDRGRLLSSIAPSEVTHAGFKLSTNVKYAAIHQYGGTIRAKTSKGLVFRMRVGTTVFGVRGKRLKQSRALNRWVRLMEVRIPRRSYVPIGRRLGRRWTEAFRGVMVGFVDATLGRR
ncbi:virion morphogenesis protein [Myxococcus phage Mx4 ts27htf-1hrm-1]|nr:virion morphogenesis protein [Myxococcus phage Mx4]WNM70392.1 virion morphogenesis protein [Myxococcus phage Mx4 ts27htf-1hrm-1]